MEKKLSQVIGDIPEVDLKSFTICVKFEKQTAQDVYLVSDGSAECSLDMTQSRQRRDVVQGFTYKCFSVQKLKPDLLSVTQKSYIMKISQSKTDEGFTTKSLIGLAPYKTIKEKMIMKVLRNNGSMTIDTKKGARKLTKVLLADKVFYIL